MLVIRLRRTGRKNQPSFRIVVTDKRRAAGKGVPVEEVGFYNPLTKERIFKKERILYWISMGAKPSDTVHNMLVAEKVIEGSKVAKHSKSKKPVEEGKPTEVVKAEEKPAEEVVSEPEGKVEEAPAQEQKSEETPIVEPEEKTEQEQEQKPEEEKKEDAAPSSEEGEAKEA
ncbi:MAG: 30S ribosomal protein S16 [bacterium]|nr:30S ribosomal protein S16 [bacterium]